MENSIKNKLRLILPTKAYYLEHSDIIKGGILKMEMSTIENTKRGISLSDFPYREIVVFGIFNFI